MKKRWFWGTLASWALQNHIRKEIRPYTEKLVNNENILEGVNPRSAALSIMKDRMGYHFDKAWPVEKTLKDTWE